MHNSVLKCSFCFALLFSAAFVGCDNPEATQSEPAADEATGDEAAPVKQVTLVNAVCPIMGNKAKSTVTTEWNGQTVGFCCPECIPEWEALSSDEQKAKLTEAAQGADEALKGHDEHVTDPEHEAT